MSEPDIATIPIEIGPEWVPVTIERPEGKMSFRFEAYEEDGRVVCGVYDLRGERIASPKAFITAMRDELSRIRELVETLGAQEIRLGGGERDWGRHLFSDFDLAPDPKDQFRRRKILS